MPSNPSPSHLPLFLGRARKYAPSPLPVLVLGETGSGKERVARLLHEESGRGGAFVPVNCGAIEPSTAISTLFGHVRGSFTGAQANRAGALRSARDGTLFLDEVAELSARAQASLLRALETGQVWPLGSDRPSSVKFRLVCATHRDLHTEVAAGRFREDLYFRIAVLMVHVPPLRERPHELGRIATELLAEHGRFMLSEAALAHLRGLPWPGNVRELRNVLYRATLQLDRGRTIEPVHLEQPAILMPAARPQWQSSELLAALADARGNRTEAARLLGISRSTLYARLHRLRDTEQARTEP